MDYTPGNTFDFVSGSYSPTTVFDFTVETPDETLATITAVLDGLSACIQAEHVRFFAEIGATLEDMVGGLLAEYDVNVQRFITTRPEIRWQDATAGVGLQSLLSRDQATRNDHKAISVQQQTVPANIKAVLETDQAIRMDGQLQIDIEQATAVRGKTELVREQGTRTERSLCARNESTLVRNIRNAVVHQQMTKVYPDRWLVLLQDSSRHQFDFTRLVWLEPPPEYRYTPNTSFSFEQHNYDLQPEYAWTFGQTTYLASGHNLGVIRNEFDSHWQPAAWQEIKLCSIIEIARRPPPGKSPWIDPPRPDPEPEPPSGETYEIPIRETYAMKHTISVTLEDLTPIDLADIKLNFDADSFAWSFSAKLLDVTQKPLVKPLPNGDSVKLIITINGYVWHILVESVKERRRFASQSVDISGRSGSALLSGPYRQPETGTQGDLLAIQQLAELHLPNGWTLDWKAVTWNVPGGVYSYQNRTPIQAIADIADAAGAIVVPARDSQTIKVIPRYPVLPWNYENVSPDITVTADPLLEVTDRPTTRVTANGVYVHGGELAGVLGFCRLNGTAGDVLIPTESNELMTDVIGVRAKGERLLAGQYIQPDIESFQLPMDGIDIPLIEVGSFVAIEIGEGETRGIVNSIEVSCQGPEVLQTLFIGEETNNQWLAFRSLLPKDPLLIGTLISTAGNASVMQLIDGGVMNVRGTGTVGEEYYIRTGQIQGEAPNLVQEEVVI
ncbi:hypothetical protein [Methylophaga sp.]|uniref:hypothetical protein n=1 Tax=Methylophaga sp. TaxID=2024840 RepID=UPI000C971AF8|nr:hypothetical protein [Methylophaga sp.]MAK67517.1 hypothetical protein [Methylophaga sp.]